MKKIKMVDNVESLKKDSNDMFSQVSEFRKCIGEMKHLHSNNDGFCEQILDLQV